MYASLLAAQHSGYPIILFWNEQAMHKNRGKEKIHRHDLHDL
jgi:hypothetical protein